jgi:hypothetical protein
MTNKAFNEAVHAAERFLTLANRVKWTEHGREDGCVYWTYDDGKSASACKRASLDLTRALAEMRRP